MTTLITSQHYINSDFVAQKVAAGDFEVQVSPVFVVDGVAYRVVLDGHHSLAAAIEAGVEPVIVERDAMDDDRVAVLDRGDVDGFLAACWMDGDYRDAVTGADVW